MLDRRHLLIVSLCVASVLAVAAIAFSVGGAARGRPARAMIPAAHSVAGIAQVGALYASDSASSHDCTAGVVDSPHDDTLITAAHCVRGSGAGMVYVPEAHGDDAPYGRWTVTSAYVDRRWTVRQDPHADVAFLIVAPQTVGGVSQEIQQVTGGFHLGSTARAGTRVRVVGYPAGADDDPISCRATVYLTKGFPSFDCHGYVGGTSGSPWLWTDRNRTRVVGVIGGLHQGGCYQYTSYSSPLDRHSRHTYRRAALGRASDTAPIAGPDGC